MDYESRQVKWYWVFAFTIYCGAVVYLLFQGNPYLYSHHDLRSALDSGESVHLHTIPENPEPVAESAPTFYQRYNFQRTAADALATPRSKNFEEYERASLDLRAEQLDATHVTQDASGIYVSGKSSWVGAINLDGTVRWKYHFKDLAAGTSVSPVMLDENSAYLIHPSGEVVCLNKISGQLRWVISLKSEVVAEPFLWKRFLIVPSKSSSGVLMKTLDRYTGKMREETATVDLKPGFQLSHAPELGAMIAVAENNIIALDPEEWEPMWSVTLTDPVKGPVIVVGTQLYAATLAAKVVKIDGAKKGKLDWETDIVKPPAGAPSYLPVSGRLTIMDTSGAMSHIDAKTGKVYWRIATENRNPLADSWSARLKGKHIEEYKMDWLHKGWSVWSPCFDNSFCIFTPKGGLITRIKLSGQLVALPLAVGQRWVFLTHGKEGQYFVSQVLEDAEIKQLKQEKESSSH